MRVNERTAETTIETQKLPVEVTRRKKAQAAVRETEEKYRTLFDSSSHAIAITTLDGKIVDVNQDYQDMVGYTLKELEGTNFQKLTPKKWHKLEAAAMKDFMSEGHGTFEKEYIRKDGTIFPVSVSAWLIRDRQGNPAGIGAFVRDITERKKAEEKLRESEEHLKTLLDSTPSGIIVIDAETHMIVDANPVTVKMFGVPKEKIIGSVCHNYICPAEKGRCPITDLRQSVDHSERVLLNADGDKVPILKTVTPVMLDGRKRLLESFVDISEHKQAQETLRESEERYRSIFENTGTATVILEEDTTISMANTEFERLSGYSRKQIEGKKRWTEFVVKDDLERMQKHHKKRRIDADAAPKSYEFHFIDRQGAIKDIFLTIDMILGTKKSVASLLDITERKRVEEELHVSEEQYRNLFESAPEAIILLGLDGTVLDVNNIAETITGVPREKAIGKHFTEFELFDEKGFSKYSELLSQFAGGESIEPVEVKLTVKGGKTRWLIVFASLLKKNNKPYAIQIITRDITERKQAEEALVKKVKIIDSITDAVITTDLNGNITSYNSGAERMYGYKAQEVIGKPVSMFYSPEDIPSQTEQIAHILQGKTIKSVEARIISENKKEVPVILSLTPVRDSQGKIVELAGVAKDITTRKQAEKALEESEEKYRTQFERALDAIVLADAETGMITDCNRAACRLVGRKKSEIVGQHQRILHPPQEMNGNISKTFKQHCGEKEGRTLETQVITKKGEIKEVAIKANIIEFRGKKILQGIFRDITERKQAERALQEAKTCFEDLFETANELIITTDVEGWVLRLNKEVEKLSGYSKKELIGQSILKIAYPEDRDKYVQFWQDILNGLSPHYELRTISKTGVVSNLLASGNAIKKDGNIVEIQYNAKDITEEKQTEEKLRQSEEKYRTILESVTESYYEIDLAGNLTFFNDSLCQTLGYTRDEMMGMNNREYMDEENAEKVYQIFNEVYRTGKPYTRVDWEIIRKDGTKLSISSSVSLIRDSQGQPIGFRGLSRDVTQQKKAAEELRQSEEKYRTILENVIEGYYEVDLAGNFTFVNDSICHNLGYSRDELLGMNNRDYMDKETAKKVFEGFAEVYTTGQPARGFEFEVIRKNGTKLVTSSSVSLVRDSQGQPTGFRGVVMDITERKQAEEKLRKSEERYKSLFETATDGIFTMDLKTRFTSGNKKAEEMCGYSREELIGKYATLILPEEEVPHMVDVFKRVLKGEIKTYETRIITKNGDLLPVEVTSSPIEIDGEIIGTMGMASDITERKKAEQTLRESEKKYRTILESITEGYYELDLAGNFTFFNDSTCKMLGYPRNELLGMNNREYEDKENARKVYQAFSEVYTTGKPVKEFEFEIIRKDGAKRFIETSASLIRDGKGEPIGFRGVSRDITERKQAEEVLRESEEKYRQLTEEINDAIYTLDKDGTATYISPVIEWMSGYSPSEIMGLPFAQFFHEEDLPRATEDFEHTLSGYSTEGEYRFRIKSGEIRWMGTSNRPIFARDRVVGARGTITDITKRKLAEQASEEARTRFEDLFESANELIITTDAEGWILHANKEVEKLSGLSKKELIGQSILKIAHPEDVPKYIQFWKDILSGLTPRYELRAISEKKPGEFRHLSASGSVIRKDGNIVEIQYNAKDITEEKQAEEKLRESEKKYRTILEDMTEGYYEVNLAGNFTLFNDSLCEIIGYTRHEMMGMNNRQYMDSENARKVYQTFNKVYATGKPARGFDWEITRKDGTKRFVEASTSLVRNAQGEPTRFRGIVRDTTERKEMEAERDEMEQRAQLASRLSIVGEMASGIVHEVNNPLTSVIGFAEMLAHKDLPEDAREYAAIINNEGQRVASIASRLLNFARHQKPETVYTDINKLVESTLELQAYEMTTGNIKVTAKLDPHLPQTMADPGQLQQVFLNIILNARTAMRAAHGGGKFSVKTQAKDDTIQISFKDDGPGIAKKHLKRIFAPFFTTRKTGEGTGLGLSICQGIISRHNGKIYAESTLGKGATFIIELPVVARQRKTATTARANGNNVWR